MGRLATALCLAVGMTVSAAPAFAQVIRMQPDFTFKRVSALAVGSQPRITVQVDPEAPRLDPIIAQPGDPEYVDKDAGPSPAATTGAVDWFWETISPAINSPMPNRFEMAVQHLLSDVGRESVGAPRLQFLQNIADRHGIEILRQTVGTRISPALVLAVIAVESAGRHDAVSHAGAQGLMQLMPATADRFGVRDSFDAAQNIRGGVEYLVWLQEHFGGDPILMLAAYNAGEGNIAKHGGVPPFAETRADVPKVLAAWEVARGLCRTRPELPSDGCVFVSGG